MRTGNQNEYVKNVYGTEPTRTYVVGQTHARLFIIIIVIERDRERKNERYTRSGDVCTVLRLHRNSINANDEYYIGYSYSKLSRVIRCRMRYRLRCMYNVRMSTAAPTPSGHVMRNWWKIQAYIEHRGRGRWRSSMWDSPFVIISHTHAHTHTRPHWHASKVSTKTQSPFDAGATFDEIVRDGPDFNQFFSQWN